MMEGVMSKRPQLKVHKVLADPTKCDNRGRGATCIAQGYYGEYCGEAFPEDCPLEDYYKHPLHAPKGERQEPLTEEEKVAIRLMGLEPVCRHCEFWGAEGLPFAECRKRHYTTDIDDTCPCFSPWKEPR